MSASVPDSNCLITQIDITILDQEKWTRLTVGPLRGVSAVLTHTVLFLFIFYSYFMVDSRILTNLIVLNIYVKSVFHAGIGFLYSCSYFIDCDLIVRF